MSINISLSKYAKNDIKDIYNYIANKILMPETAINQIIKIYKGISKLGYLPERNKVYGYSKTKKKEIRRLIIDNYGIYYSIDKNLNEIIVLAILYNKCSEKTIMQKLNR